MELAGGAEAGVGEMAVCLLNVGGGEGVMNQRGYWNKATVVRREAGVSE